jgi:general secretion pathway protein D
LAGHDERVTAKVLENVLMLAQGIALSPGCGAVLLQCIIAAFMSYPEWVNLLRKRELFPKQSRPTWVAVIASTLILSLVLPLAADSAHSLFKKGRDAEARHDVEAAYEFYKQAYDKKPKELGYQASYQRLRFEAAAKKVSRGQMLREQGQLDAALAEFQKAAEIDPSSFVAQQEVKRTQQIIQQQQAPQPPQAQAPPPDNAIKQRLAQAQGPVELQAISDQPITLKLTEDTKVIYETIGKLAGINVLFDPDYTSRRIKIELNGVTLPEALEIVAFESKTFWRPITSNSIFVAADTTAKRKELEQSVVKTFYLSNVSQPTELQDIVNAMRTILEINRIQQLPSQSAIVVRGTPDQVALADKLINDIDKARPEVVVDVAILQVQKGKLQTLGITPPASITATLTPNNGGVLTGTGGTASAAQLGSLKGFSPSRNLSVSLPSATANFLYNDNSTKIIQNPQIRALDGQKASLKIGDRVPVATGSFQPGIGGVGINPLVNTQFQYIDVGVNIDVTPRIHANREVTLKLMLDISAVTRTANIGGIDQPVIGQRKIEHEIRLKEGETNLLGGILENSDVKNLTGIPGLAQVPFFKYFFASDHKEKNDNEIVFLLTPHIVRSQDISELNTRSLDVGSGSAIELRRAPVRPVAPPQTQPTPQPQPAPQSNPQQPQATNQQLPALAANQPAPAQPEATAAPAPNATADRAVLNFDPANTKQAKGQTFTVNLLLNSPQQMHSFSVQLQYDPKLLQLANISNGGFLSSDGQAVAIVHRDDSAGGKLQITATRPPGSGGVNGNGSVFTLTFVAKAPGNTTIAPIGLFPRDESGTPIMMSAGQATVSIQ